MGNTKILNTPSSMSCNRYSDAKVNATGQTLCDLCQRSLKAQDRTTHKNSKKHRVNEEDQKAKESVKTNGNGFNDFSGEPSGFVSDSGFDLAPIDSRVDTFDVSGNKGSSSSGGVGNSFVSGRYGGKGSEGKSVGMKSGSGKSGGSKRGGGKVGNCGNDRTCYGCGEIGHTKRDCPKGTVSNDRACYSCGEVGHTKRDCPKGGPGSGGQTCFNCGLEGHRKVDCTEPLKPRGGGGGRTCFNCLKPGHNSSDCSEPRVDRCRNCDAEGHHSKNCNKPRDWSRVKCNNCSQYGHGARRCPEPAGGTNTYGSGGGWGDAVDSSSAAIGGWDNVDADGAGAQETSGNWADDTTNVW